MDGANSKSLVSQRKAMLYLHFRHLGFEERLCSLLKSLLSDPGDIGIRRVASFAEVRFKNLGFVTFRRVEFVDFYRQFLESFLRFLEELSREDGRHLDFGQAFVCEDG